MGTHSGSFHADEALGISLLRQTAEFKNADLTRTRDPKICMLQYMILRLQQAVAYLFSCITVDTLDIVIDVGAVYDPARHRYDHHQKEFDEVFGDGTYPYNSKKIEGLGRELEDGKEFSIKLSSAGLVWK